MTDRYLETDAGKEDKRKRLEKAKQVSDCRWSDKLQCYITYPQLQALQPKLGLTNDEMFKLWQEARLDDSYRRTQTSLCEDKVAEAITEMAALELKNKTDIQSDIDNDGEETSMAEEKTIQATAGKNPYSVPSQSGADQSAAPSEPEWVNTKFDDVVDESFFSWSRNFC